MRDTAKGHAALRRSRVSIPRAEYFITVCAEGGRHGLSSESIARSILAECRAMDGDGTWQLRCAVVMPNHLHAVIILGERLTLGRCVARLKAKTSSMLLASGIGLAWERDFFDRHVRPDDDRLSLFLYVFLNPYRAALCGRKDSWPWYYCRPLDWAWFREMLEADRPVPAWLR